MYTWDSWSNECACIGICMSDTGPSGPPGSMCDDGNANTVNDVWDEVCGCGGIGPWIDCIGIMGGDALPGTPCDDEDPETTQDTWSPNCECIGDSLGQSTGMSSLGQKDLHTWPNPVRDHLMISVNNTLRHAHICVLDANGRPLFVAERPLMIGAVGLSVEALPQGLYTLRIEPASGTLSRRFVVSR